MTRRAALAAALIFVGCGGEQPPNAVPGAPEAQLIQTAAAPSVSVTGLELTMHDDSPTFGEARKPAFRLRAEQAEERGANQWAVRGVQAEAVKDGDEPITFRAVSGTFDGEQQIARLEGEVTLASGSVSITLEDVAWDGKSGTAHSDRPSMFRDGATELAAQRLRIDANDRSYTLEEASGRISLRSIAP